MGKITARANLVIFGCFWIIIIIFIFIMNWTVKTDSSCSWLPYLIFKKSSHAGYVTSLP